MEGSVDGAMDNRYRIHRESGRSPDALLFIAEHVMTRRTVSLLQLRGEARKDEAKCSRFSRDIHWLSLARHRSVVAVLDAGDQHGAPWMVTELLDGRTLESALAARRLPSEETLALGIELSSALGYAHDKGLVHSGLHPGVIFMPSRARRDREMARGFDVPSGKLMSFGLAPNPLSPMDGPLAAMGYAAPERLAGEEASPRSDVYALGAILYECLTGELPNRDVGSQDPSDVVEGVPRSLAKTVARALSSPGERFEEAAPMLDALRFARKTEPPPASRPTPARRAHVRAAYAAPLRLVHAGATHDGRSEDISEGGMLVLVNGPIDAGERVQVRFTLPTNGERVTLAAVERWCREGRGGMTAIGVAFEDLSEAVIDDIAKYAAFFGEVPAV